MRALSALLAISSLLAASFAFAQEPADATPECNPARPTIATPATLTPVGYLQFENGGQYASGSQEFATQSSANQVTKLTVHPRLQFLVLSEPFARSEDQTGIRSWDAGGISAGMQGVLSPGKGVRPTIAVSYFRLIYAGTAPDIDIGTAKNSAILLVSTDVAGLHFDINGFLFEQTGAGVRRAQFGQTVSTSHSMGKVTLAEELWHFSQPLSQGNAVDSLSAVSYAFKKNLVVDAGFDRGLTSTSTQWEGFAGFTYLLPHRLWRAR
ncbi:MAG: hypothetical protein WCA89_17490 [Terracidiphilus sp.]